MHNTCWEQRLAQFLDYAGSMETKSLTSMESTLNHLEGVLKILDKTKTDNKIIKLIGDKKNWEIKNGIMEIIQNGNQNATYIYENGGFQIFRDGKLVVNKLK